MRGCVRESHRCKHIMVGLVRELFEPNKRERGSSEWGNYLKQEIVTNKYMDHCKLTMVQVYGNITLFVCLLQSILYLQLTTTHSWFPELLLVGRSQLSLRGVWKRGKTGCWDERKGLWVTLTGAGLVVTVAAWHQGEDTRDWGWRETRPRDTDKVSETVPG